jgi:hypothetical protein
VLYLEIAATLSIVSGKSVRGQRSNQLNYISNLVSYLIGTRVFSGFPQVQSIRLRRVFQSPNTNIL